MKQELKDNNLIITIPLRSLDENYVLVYTKRTSEWSVNYLIDRSYKGKDPDIGCPLVYVSEEIAEKLKPILGWIEL